MVVDASPFFTVSDLQLGVTRPRSSTYDGTWGVWLKNAADVLVTRFNISAVFTQDVAVQACQTSTVISNGVGRNLSINPLYAGPYGILVSNVDFGTASIPYGLSGAAPKVSSFFTFWNVKVSVSPCLWVRSLSWDPTSSSMPHGHVVGVLVASLSACRCMKGSRCARLHHWQYHVCFQAASMVL